MATVDLCVIGGGPAGCFAAFHVVRYGSQPIVLEEHPAIGEPVDYSGTIAVRVLDHLDSQVRDGHRPDGLNPKAEYLAGDVRDIAALQPRREETGGFPPFLDHDIPHSPRV